MSKVARLRWKYLELTPSLLVDLLVGLLENKVKVRHSRIQPVRRKEEDQKGRGSYKQDFLALHHSVVRLQGVVKIEIQH